MDEDKLAPDEVARLWAKSFPKRHDDIKAKGLCMVFAQMVEILASQGDEEDEIVNVQEALKFYGIPREEFYQVEKETEDE
jgi:hypothetical protein